MFIDLRSFIRSFLYKNWERLNRAPRRIQGHLPLIRQSLSKTLKLNFFINSLSSVKKSYWAWIFLYFLFNFFQVFPTELRDSGINFAAIAAKLVTMSAPYTVDLVRRNTVVRSNHLHIYSQPSFSNICRARMPHSNLFVKGKSIMV